MKHKWLDLAWPQRILIFIQAFLILLFLTLYCTVGRQQAIEYRGEHLRYRSDNQITTYSGKIGGKEAVFTVTENTLEYRLGDTVYGPYTVVEDPTAIPSEKNMPFNVTSLRALTGIEIWEGSGLLFRGSYLHSGSVFLLYDENGESVPSISIFSNHQITVEPGIGSTTIQVIDSTPTVQEILQIALVSNISQRGYFGGFALGVVLSILCAISILYADNLFRWNLRFQIRNAEDAEPSDWELFSRWIGWITITILALVVFILGLNYTH